MKERLGKIIKEIRIRKNKKLLLIIGDGIDPIHEINTPETIVSEEQKLEDEEARKEGKNQIKTVKDQDAIRKLCWRNFEYARLFTSNSLPIFSYFLIWYLAEAGLIGTILTTNYDQFFDSIYQKIVSKKHLAINPLRARKGYDWQGYYCTKPLTKKTIKLYRIHGSLSHVIFLNCSHIQPHIFKLPTFLVAYDIGDICSKFPIKLLHYSLNYLNQFYKRVPHIMCHGDTGNYIHFMDTMLSSKNFFKKEIDQAIRALANLRSVAAVVSIGFTGSPNEELLQPTKQIIAQKRCPFFYIISEKQKEAIRNKSGYLYHHMLNYSPNNIGTFSSSSDFLGEVIEKSGLDVNELKARYHAEWVFGNIFENRAIFPRAVYEK